MTTVVLEADASAEAHQVEALARDLEGRATELAEEAETVVDGQRITVTLFGAGEDVVGSLAIPPPGLSLGVGTEPDSESTTEDCEAAMRQDGFACDREGSLHEVETLVELEPPRRVEPAGDGRGIAIELSEADADVLWEFSSDAACRREAGELTYLLLVLDDEIVSSAPVALGVQCGVGISGGEMQLDLGSDATPQDVTRLSSELARAGLPEYSVEAIEERHLGD